MKKLTIIFSFIFLFFSCKNENKINTKEKPKVDTIESRKSQSTQKTEVEKEDSETLTMDEDYIQKATINKSDSLIWITTNMKLDHRIFGFEKPSLNSRKMILISIFTPDVEGNPFNCPYGAYYDSSNMSDIELKFKENIGDFAKIDILIKNEKRIVYFEKKWLEFEQEK